MAELSEKERAAITEYAMQKARVGRAFDAWQEAKKELVRIENELFAARGEG